QAERVYRWVDKDGNVSYHDRPPPGDSAGKVEERQFRVREGRATAATDTPKVAVVIYTVPQCSSCDQVRAHLEKRGVPFSEKNVDKDRAAQNELQKRSGGLSVPTIIVGEKVMKGYIDSLLDGELDAAGFEKPTTPP
ncbi:MAG: glutaredoxin family protein, partial [Pseudomonadota bacterium]